MKKSKLILLGLLILYSCEEKNEKKENSVKQYTIEQFLENENSFANGFSSDKKNIYIFKKLKQNMQNLGAAARTPVW